MSANLARTADGWWLVTPAGLIPLGLTAPTTAALLADRPALDAAVETARLAAAADPHEAVPAGSLDLLSPVTAPARIVAQMVNYRSHAIDSGMNPDTVPPAFFRKASHSLTGPAGDIIRPHGVSFLDYEVELGLVIGADCRSARTVTDATLAATWPHWWSPTTSAPGRSSSPRPSSTRPSPTPRSPRPARG